MLVRRCRCRWGIVPGWCAFPKMRVFRILKAPERGPGVTRWGVDGAVGRGYPILVSWPVGLAALCKLFLRLDCRC